MKIYLLGSLRNPRIPEVAIQLRGLGHDVFDDWYSPGPDTDEQWQLYEKQRGRTYKEAIAGYHARHVFEFDKYHIDQADVVVMVLPCGKSAHLELGYALGQGKQGYVLFEGEPERFDVMYQFATGLCFSEEELYDSLRQVTNRVVTAVDQRAELCNGKPRVGRY